MPYDTEPAKVAKGRTLLSAAGLAAVAAGIVFAGIQPIHPPDFTASVTTTWWAAIMALKFIMCLLFLVGFTGLFLGQLDRIGWLGALGFVLLVLCWWLQAGFVFAEAFILPVLADGSAAFVDSFLAMFNGGDVDMPIGILPALYGVAGVTYLLGGVSFGVATYRARRLPRVPAALMAGTALVTPLAVLLPHEVQRLIAMPYGLAVAWLGLALTNARYRQGFGRMDHLLGA